MSVKAVVFAARRYYADEKNLMDIYEKIRAALSADFADIELITEAGEAERLEGGDVLVCLPVSGSVQPNIIAACKKYSSAIVYAGYVSGNFDGDVTRTLLINNAAPSCADVYSVLKREDKPIYLIKSLSELRRKVKVLSAYFALKGAKLLLIGEVEPWVISADRNLEDFYTKMGISFEKIPLSEIIDEYNGIGEGEVNEFCKMWKEKAKKTVEPNEKDLLCASKFNAALLRLIEKHNALGCAIACFKLIGEIGTTACLAASYINTYTKYVVACEGDVDSAVTMLLTKALTNETVWMANPNLQSDESVNFVHCSAPVKVNGKELPLILRSHHESGVGVSTEVTLPTEYSVTAIRISDSLTKATVQRGVAKSGLGEPSCRTQLRVCFDDYGKYISTLLGCHQVFSFGDIKEDMTELIKLFGIEVL